jgi:ssDNA thymidine ADP-ribosyltransferase, DarT
VALPELNADKALIFRSTHKNMAYNINTGRNVPKRTNSEIIILVSSLPKLIKDGIRFLFTDRHASATVPKVKFSEELNELDRIDWKILQARDFSRDNDDLDKTSRYQAEALVYKHMPLESLLGVACCDTDQRRWVDDLVSQNGITLKSPD